MQLFLLTVSYYQLEFLLVLINIAQQVFPWYSERPPLAHMLRIIFLQSMLLLSNLT